MFGADVKFECCITAIVGYNITFHNLLVSLGKNKHWGHTVGVSVVRHTNKLWVFENLCDSSSNHCTDSQVNKSQELYTKASDGTWLWIQFASRGQWSPYVHPNNCTENVNFNKQFTWIIWWHSINHHGHNSFYNVCTVLLQWISWSVTISTENQLVVVKCLAFLLTQYRCTVSLCLRCVRPVCVCRCTWSSPCLIKSCSLHFRCCWTHSWLLRCGSALGWLQ